eukprot:12765583-Alexandrium_andersonii.AAC.1
MSRYQTHGCFHRSCVSHRVCSHRAFSESALADVCALEVLLRECPSGRALVERVPSAAGTAARVRARGRCPTGLQADYVE